MRTGFEEIMSAAQEARWSAATVVGAGGSAARAGFNAGRETVEDAGDDLRRSAEKVVERVGEAAQNGRTEVRKVTKQATAAADDMLANLDSSRSRHNGSKATVSAAGRARKSTASGRKETAAARKSTATARKSAASSRGRKTTAARTRKPVSITSGRRSANR